jgi:predicted dehydrogenase
LAHQLQAKFSTTNYFEILEDSQVDAVLIATHHHFHAKMAVDALKAGKHVFLEKPLALNREELKTISETINSLDKVPTLVVGFNRRYAPYSIQAKQIFSERQFPLIMTFRVNAGRLPLGHWALGDEGGGRLRGEACHMVDFFRSVIGRPLTNVSISSLSSSDNSGVRPDENFSAQFSYEDGSLGNLIYTSQGDAALPKEFIEIHGGGQSIVIDDFKNYSYFGPKMSTQSNAQDKGHKEIMNVFLNAVRSGQTFPIPWEELHETTQACSELDDSVWGRIS